MTHGRKAKRIKVMTTLSIAVTNLPPIISITFAWDIMDKLGEKYAREKKTFVRSHLTYTQQQQHFSNLNSIK